MGRNGICAVTLFLFCLWDLSSAWSFRSLIDSEPKEKTLISPLSSPVSDGGYQTNTTSSTDGDIPKKEDHQQEHQQQQKPIMNSPEVDLDPKATNNTVNSTSFPVTPLKDNPQIDEEKGTTPNKTSLGSDTNESCNDPTKTCKTGEMIACFQGLGNGIKNIVILVQNEGEITIRVTVKQPSLENTTDPLEVHGHQIGKIDIPVTDDPKIVLNAGSGDCELNIGPSSPSRKEDIFQKFQFYYNQVTPIYGACMFFVVAMIVGGIWSCCKFSKGNQEGEIPYQELEMGSPGSASALNIDSAEGWDQVWDDDWDEENAVKSPVGRKNRVGSVSAKGIPARSSNNRVEDGWDNDWDD